MSHSNAMRRLISDMKHRQANITLALYFQFVLVRAQNAYLPRSHVPDVQFLTERVALNQRMKYGIL